MTNRSATNQDPKLTRLRAAVLDVLVKAGRPVKAYDIVDAISDGQRRIPAATVYRILDYLLVQGLVHRIAAINAFVACCGRHDRPQMLLAVCRNCRTVLEITDAPFFDALYRHLESLGFSSDADGGLEVQGICRACALPV